LPSDFKTVVSQNHQTNHHKPSATCTTLAAKPYYHAFLLLLIGYTGPAGSESRENQNASLLNNILLMQDYFLHTAFEISCTPQKTKYKGADKSLARPGRKQATATEDFDFHISYL
jgi:hypothetical protein